MKKFFLMAFLAFFAATGFAQENAAEKQRDILRLLELTNTRDLCIQIFDMMIPQFAQLAPGVPDSFWDLARQRIAVDDFITLYIPIYDRHFSHQEIRELIAFYQTPIGKRLVEKTPAITADSMTAGQEWGMKMGQMIMLELIKSGYIDT